MTTYQLDYAAGRPQMYDRSSREQKAVRIIKLLEIYFGKNKLKNLSVFNIGCSTGIIDNILAKKFKTVSGGDIDKDAVEFAKKHFQRRNLKFQVEDAMNLSFKDAAFDIVICTHIYEHVPNPEKLFLEIKRVLKPKGICYLAAVNKFWLLESHYNLPFLSYLPRSLANLYMKLTKKGDVYYEHPESYWGLKKLTRDFKVLDYTDKILADPKRFGFDIIPFSFGPLSRILRYFSPTFFWILVKKD